MYNMVQNKAITDIYRSAERFSNLLIITLIIVIVVTLTVGALDILVVDRLRIEVINIVIGIAIGSTLGVIGILGIAKLLKVNTIFEGKRILIIGKRYLFLLMILFIVYLIIGHFFNVSNYFGFTFGLIYSILLSMLMGIRILERKYGKIYINK